MTQKTITKRQSQEKTERRKRVGQGLSSRLKLHVPEEIKDKNYEYRWINDDGNRIYDKTKHDDWDPVSADDKNEIADAGSIDSIVSKRVGTNEAGQPIKAILCRKLKKYCDEDRREKRQQREAVMEQINHGSTPGADTSENENMYLKKEHGIRKVS